MPYNRSLVAAFLSGILLLGTLASCVPAPTIAEPDDAALKFVQLPRGDLAVVANAPIEYGDVRVRGEQLEIRSEFCATSGCLPNERGFIQLTYPDDGKRNYGPRLEIDVVAGTPELGRALVTLQSEDVSREAGLKGN